MTMIPKSHNYQFIMPQAKISEAKAFVSQPAMTDVSALDKFIYFGNSDEYSFNPSNEAPKLKYLPKITVPQLERNVKAQFQKSLWRAAGTGINSYREVESEKKKGTQYLPKFALDRLRKYTWSPAYWFDVIVRDRFQTGFSLRKKAVLMGIGEIKRCQAEVEKKRALIANIDLADEFLKSLGSFSANILRVFAKGAKLYLQNQVKVYKTLQDDVPTLNEAYFKPALAKIQSGYQKKYDTDLKIIKPLGAGSVARVYLAESEKHGKVVVKVTSEDASPERIKSYRNYLYYQGLIQYGLNQKERALFEADQVIRVLLDEVQLDKEEQKARVVKDYLVGIESKVQVPEFYYSEPNGFVQSYAGDVTLNHLQDKNKKLFQAAVDTISPDLIRLMVVSPYKYLDFHSGNIVVDTTSPLDNPKCTLIDYGRMVVLDTDKNQRILDYYKTLYTGQRHEADVSGLIEGNLIDDDVDIYNRDMSRNGLLRGWTTHTAFWAEGRANKDRLQLYPLGEQAVANLDIQDIVTKFTGMLKWFFASTQDIAGERKPGDILQDFESAKLFFEDKIQNIIKHDKEVNERKIENEHKKRRREDVDPITSDDWIPWDLKALEKKIPGLTNLLRQLGNNDNDAYQVQLQAIQKKPLALQNLYTAVRSLQRLHTVSRQLATDLEVRDDVNVIHRLEDMLKDTFQLRSYGLT
jgi:hypothetical protein